MTWWSVGITFITSVVLTYSMRRFALQIGVVDDPGAERKVHTRVTPLLGGVAVISAWCFGVFLSWGDLIGGYLLPKHLIGLIVASVVLMIGGALDDRFDLSPAKQILFPVLATIIVIAAGIGVEYITNPIGGVFRLDALVIEVFQRGGLPYRIVLLADLFAFVWVLGATYTTKFLDGLDGLVSGVTIIGAMILYWLSMTDTVFQPETAHLAILTAAAFAGFLVWNWHPAKIFLGESGSLFAGFILGVLAIISGGKIATALLILGIPLLDVVWVVARRLCIEKRSPFQADRKHLHLRLVDAGLSQRQAVLVLYVMTAVFGSASLLLQTPQKVYAFVGLLVVMVALGVWVLYRYRRSH